MRVGAIIPVTGTLPVTPGLAKLGRLAESAGVASVWVDDHLVGVPDARSRYPYSEDGLITWSPSEDRYECLTSCTWLAAATSKCRIGTAVLVLPQRNALELAKVAASLDRLSRGRFVLGVGIGWNRAEMEALGYSFEGRGNRADQMLRTLRQCWGGSGAVASSRDRAAGVQSILMHPTPVSRIPVLVGGMSHAALRRAASQGDGWLAVAQVATLDLSWLRNCVARLRSQTVDSANRAPFEYVLKLHGGADAPETLNKLAVDAARAGFTEVIIEPDWRDPEGAVALLRAVVRTAGQY